MSGFLISPSCMRRRPSSMLLAAATLIATFASPFATAASVGDQISLAARTHVLELATTAGLADPSVTLKLVGADAAALACNGPVEVTPVDTRFITRMKFAANCKGQPTWRQEFVLRGEIEARVVVATAPIPAGRPIAATELALEKRTIDSMDGASSVLEDVVGQSSRRALRAGQVLDRRWLAQSVLVRRGASVRIVATNGPVQVTTSGEALAAGRAGDVIDVRNATTGRVIRARVTAQNVVEPADMAASSIPQSPR